MNELVHYIKKKEFRAAATLLSLRVMSASLIITLLGIVIYYLLPSLKESYIYLRWFFFAIIILLM